MNWPQDVEDRPVQPDIPLTPEQEKAADKWTTYVLFCAFGIIVVVVVVGLCS